MRRWRMAFLTLLLCVLWHGFVSKAPAGLCMQLDWLAALPQGPSEHVSDARTFTNGLIGVLSRRSEPERPPPTTAEIRNRPPSLGDEASGLFNAAYAAAARANTRNEFARCSTTTLAATGQQRFVRGEPAKAGIAAPQGSRNSISPKRPSQAAFNIDVRPPSSLTLAVLGCCCCLLWFAWQARFQRS